MSKWYNIVAKKSTLRELRENQKGIIEQDDYIKDATIDFTKQEENIRKACNELFKPISNVKYVNKIEVECGSNYIIQMRLVDEDYLVGVLADEIYIECYVDGNLEDVWSYKVINRFPCEIKEVAYCQKGVYQKKILLKSLDFDFKSILDTLMNRIIREIKIN